MPTINPTHRVTPAFTRLIFVFSLILMGFYWPTEGGAVPKPPNVVDVVLTASSAAVDVGQTVTLDVTVAGFNDITSFSFSMNWQRNLLQFVSITPVSNLLRPSSFNTSNASNGYFTVDWADANATSLPANTVLFRITFRSLAYSGQGIPVSFSSIPQPIVFFDNMGSINAITQNGRVTTNSDGTCGALPAGLSCQNARVLCPSDLPFCHTLPAANNQTALGGTFCGSIENNHWLAFDAGSTNMDVRVAASNCSSGPNGNGDGVQVLFLEANNCTTFTRLAPCATADFSNSYQVTVSLTNLVVGQRYYIMLDGQRNDICDYRISVVNGQILGTQIQGLQMTGSATVCRNTNNLTYSIPAVSGALQYIWQVPSGAQIMSGQGTPSVNVSWGTQAGDVCVRVVGRCDTSAPLCQSVALGASASRTINAFKCATNSYILAGQTYTSPGTYTLTLQSSTGCDSVITLQLSDYPEVIHRIDTTICSGGSFSIYNSTYTTAGIFRDTVFGGSLYGCDSIIELRLKVINFDLVAQKNADLSCGNTSSLLSAVLTNINPNSTRFTYVWQDSNGQTIGNGSSQSVSLVGTYRVTVTATSEGVSCSKTATVTVGQTGSVPAKPILAGAAQACMATTETYSVVNFDPNHSYTWQSTGILTDNGSQADVLWPMADSGRVCVLARNGCGQSDTTCLSVSLSDVPSAVTILGDTAVCPTARTTYRANGSADILRYAWSIVGDGRLVSGQGSPSVIVEWGQQSGRICLEPINGCGAGVLTCLDVAVNNAPPVAFTISGDTVVCPNDTLFYSVQVSNSMTYRWVVPTGARIIGRSDTHRIQVLWAIGTSGDVCLDLTNACQQTRRVCLPVRVNEVRPEPFIITGADTACANVSTVLRTATQPLPAQYQWQVPVGATIQSGQGTNQINIDWGNISGNTTVALEVSNACRLTQHADKQIFIKNIPLDTPVFRGGVSPCPNTVVEYFYPGTHTDIVSYTWRFPAGVTVLSGQGTPYVRVNWGLAGSGNVCLSVENTCGVRREFCQMATLRTNTTPLLIEGPATVCKDTVHTFSVTPDANISLYAWRVPSDAVIVSGQGTATVRVRLGNTGVVQMVPQGGCSDGLISQKSVQVETVTAAPTGLSGLTTVCEGLLSQYSIRAVAGATAYKWELPTGAQIIGNTSDTVVNIQFGANSGTVCVSALNACGWSLPTCMTLRVVPQPQVFAGNDTLICGVAHILRGGGTAQRFEWSTLESPVGAQVVFDQPTQKDSRVSVSIPGVYTFVLKAMNGSCEQSDIVQIDFKSVPRLTLVQTVCNAEATAYQVQMNVVGGQSPFVLRTPLSAVVTDRIILTGSVASGSTYAVAVADAFGCLSDTLKGSKICDCQTSAGTLNIDSLVVCYGSSVRVQHKGDFRLDPNDLGEYILHDGSKTRIGNIIVKNNTGIFLMDEALLTYDRPYYITFLAGNNRANSVDTTDRCWSKSNTVPIIFKPQLTAALIGDTVICRNSTAYIMFEASRQGTYNMRYTDSLGQIFSLNNVGAGLRFGVSPVLPTYLSLVAVRDADGCTATFTDSARVDFLPQPMAVAGADQTVCTTQTVLNAVPAGAQTTGIWISAVSGAVIESSTAAQTRVSGLVKGKNAFIWRVQDNVCANYTATDTVNIFLPTIPNANKIALETVVGQPVSGNITENAPDSTFSVTRLSNPEFGRLEVFSRGRFTFIPDDGRVGIAKFKFMICSEICLGVCDTGEVRILVKSDSVRTDSVRVDIPNVITVNDDGKNDTWIIDGLEAYPNNELTVFNRWGSVLYQAKPYKNDWNGLNNNGEPLAEGTYYYVLRLNVNEGKVLKGDITVLR